MKITLIVSRYDAGHLESGWGLGARAIVEAGLAEALAKAGHEVTVEEIGQVEGVQGREIATGFAVCAAIAGKVRAAREAGRFPFIVAGNCMTAAGAVAGEEADAVVWVDQHGDLHTPETSASGLLDGMALSAVLGWSWQSITANFGLAPIAASNCLLVDARDLDTAEADMISDLAIHHVGVEQAIDAAGGLSGAERVHLHLDLDVHNPAVLRANAYNAAGGPTPEDLRQIAGAIAAKLPLSGVTVTAYDPALDSDGTVADQAIRLIVAVADAPPQVR